MAISRWPPPTDAAPLTAAAAAAMTIASSSRLTLDGIHTSRLADTALDAARTYAWADRQENAVLVSCRDVVRMSMASRQGGLDVYLHRKRPCRHVVVVGTVVGVTEKESAVRYQIDDGTSVLEVLYRGHANSAPTTSAQRQIRRDRQMAKPHEAPSLYDPDYPGIPAQYLPPPPKPRPQSSAAQARHGPLPSPLLPGCHVGSLVRAAGRIATDWDGRRRLDVDAGGGHSSKVLGSLEILDDPNQELEHILERIRLAQDIYSQPFVLPPAAESLSRPRHAVIDSSGEATPRAHAVRKLPPETLRALRELRGEDEVTQSRAWFVETRSDIAFSKRTSPSPEPKPSRRPKVRRFLPIDSVPPAPSAHSRRDSPSKPRASRVPSRSLPFPSPSRQPSLSSPSSVASRKLRHHSKLADERITDDLFRLHVQRWVVEHCGVALDNDAASASETQRMPAPPPLFTLAYLLRVPDLTSLGRRLIGLKLQRRERKQAAERLTGKAGPSTGSNSSASSEPLAVKLERLFGWAVRQMVHDGLVALGPCGCSAEPPYDGRRPEGMAPAAADDEEEEAPPSSGSYSGIYQRSQTARRSQRRSDSSSTRRSQLLDTRSAALREADLLEWSDEEGSETAGSGSGTESELDSALGTPTQARPYGLRLPSVEKFSCSDKKVAAKKGKQSPDAVECYQLVHPCSLAPDLSAVMASLQADQGEVDAARALERLRRRDERWRFVAESTVREGLEWVLEMGRMR